MPIRARVSHGRLIIDEPVDLPDGTVLDLVVDDEGDGLDDEERVALHAQLKASADQAAVGQTRSVAVLLAELHRER